ncbi:unnamed protein product [Blepharisma stoltei]|uniref:GB1/RHD3-type G domain-containing protein n=1 Tax=Blepharisma stoltei TaxID=1481888 RepID=A0AAU9JRI0_9CILI|nr:unnamed protein product [Blepharisma stoltei]
MNSKAIPLIIYEREGFRVTPESLEFLRNLEGKVGVIAVVGKYRTGKSFLLNRVILDNRDGQGFGVGPTINACTKGLWVWSEPVEIENSEGERMKVLVIDSEGLGAFDEDANHDTRIFLLALLLSSYFVYNSVGTIDENALQNLSLIVNLSKQLQIRSSQGPTNPDEIANYFPSFLWVLRDFALRLVDGEGNPISARKYLENALVLQKGVSDNIEAKNRIRRLLSTFFKDRDCFSLVRPTEREDVLQKLDNAPEEVFRPEFLSQAEELKKKIFTKVKPKTLNGQMLTGEMLGQLAIAYTEAINKGGVPNIEGAWTSVCQAECQKGVDDCMREFEQEMREISKRLPLKEEEIYQLQAEIGNKLVKKFKEKALGDSVTNFKQQLKLKLKERALVYKEKNERLSQERAQKELEAWGVTLQNQLKNKEITNFAVLKTTIESFSKTFRADSITKSMEIKLLEYLIQLYTESADYILASSLTEIQNECRRLYQQLEFSQDQVNRRKAEFEAEKDQLKRRLEEYERELCTLKASQATSAARMEDLIREKKRIEESYEERIQYLKENTSEKIEDLKSKYQDASEKLNSLQNSSQKQIADLQRDNALLRQELEFIKNEEIEYKRRRNEAESEAKELRNKLRNAQSEKTDRSEKTENNEPKIIYETNKYLSFAFEKLELRCQQLEEKVERLKKCKKLIKNCSALQCKICGKYLNSNVFSAHVIACLRDGPASIDGKLMIEVPQTTIRDEGGKPYTEYVISFSNKAKSWNVSRKYKMFCNLHSSLQQQFPHLNLPEFGAVFSQNSSSITSRKPTILEERKKGFQIYLTELSNMPIIKECTTFRKFIGLDFDPIPSQRYPNQDTTPPRGYKSRGKSVYDMVTTSRMFSDSSSPVLSPITNTYDIDH